MRVEFLSWVFIELSMAIWSRYRERKMQSRMEAFLTSRYRSHRKKRLRKPGKTVTSRGKYAHARKIIPLV
jgi:hypothetical protein